MSEPTPEKRTTKLGQGIVTLTAFKGSKGLDKVKDNADIDAKKTEEEEWTGVGSIPRLGVKRRLTVRNSQPLTLQEKKEKKKIEGKKELHINDYWFGDCKKKQRNYKNFYRQDKKIYNDL